MVAFILKRYIECAVNIWIEIKNIFIETGK